MLLSRFWYVVLSLCLGATVFVMLLAVRVYNRHGDRAMAEALYADSSAVGWYLKDDARRRSAALIPVSLDPELREALAKASDQEELESKQIDVAAAVLRKAAEDVPEDLKFTAMWAVDANGRVVGNAGFDLPRGHDLGGYSIVGDALRGWIRDDAWVWREVIYRVVARPVQKSVGAAPVGAVIGIRAVDATYAGAVSKRTGAAVGFYVQGQMVAKHAPVDFDPANLDYVAQDLKNLETNTDYQDKGRTDVSRLTNELGVVYARLPGEARDLGAGFAVGRLATVLDTPFDFFDVADDTDQQAVPAVMIGGGALLLAFLGLLFSFFEHSQPIRVFAAEALKLAEGKIDVLSPSKFRGTYKKIASDLNDGMEKVAAKGGAPRRAADLEEVLGPIPAQPAMSAFSVPGGDGATSGPVSERPPAPGAPAPTPSSGGAQRLKASSTDAGGAKKPLPQPKRALPKPKRSQSQDDGEAAEPASEPALSAPAESAPVSTGPASGDDEMEDWRRVYEDFITKKKECGENTSSMTFEKFKGTLERNKKALVERHNCSRVKFTVYVKNGKAALKASPVK